jgi:hypothetical protein
MLLGVGVEKPLKLVSASLLASMEYVQLITSEAR